MISISENYSSRVIQFDGTNFGNWKYRLGILLDEKGLKEYIIEKLDDILSSKEASTHGSIRKQEKSCISIIVQSIHDSQLEYVKDQKFAKDMYDGLVAVFERKSISGRLLVRKQLLNMKMHDGDVVSEHFLKFDKLIRDLKSTGATVEELDIVCHLILTLPRSYDTLVTALETMNPNDLSLDFVKSRILDEYGKRNNNEKGNKSNNGHAMQAKNPDIVCFQCGKKGHIKSMCRQRNAKKKSKSNTNPGGNKKDDTANAASSEKECTLCAFDENDLVECANACADHACRNMNEHGGRSTHSNAKQIKFVLDSGASEHMVNNKNYFSVLSDIDQVNITVAKKDQKLIAKKRGNIVIKTFCNGGFDTKTIKNVLLIEDLKCNLMSINILTNRGYAIEFKGDCALITFDGKLQFIAYKRGKLYEITFQLDCDVFAGLTTEQSKGRIPQALLHFRLGHLNVNDMRKLITRKMVTGLDHFKIDTNKKFCETCIFGKQTRTSFPPNQRQRSNRVLELIHSDVCGPISQMAWDKSRYFVTFTDDYTRASMVYCIEHKNEVFEIFKQYVAMSESYHGVKVASLRVDNGGEYSSNNFKNYCKQKGIRIVYTVPYNPEMNSVSERLNRTLQEKARSMLLAADIDWKFWNEAVLTANYLKNRSPTSACGKRFDEKTPAELWFGKKPDMSNIRVFGSTCYNHIPVDNRKKLDAKSSKCIMLGYGQSHGTYRLWDIESDRFISGRHVIFEEKSILNRAKVIEISDSEAVTDTHAFDDDTNDTLNTTEEHFTDAEDDLSEHDSNGDDVDANTKEFHDIERNDIGNNIIHSANRDRTGNHNENVHDVKGDIGNNNVRRSKRVRQPVVRYGDWEYDAHYAFSAEEYVQDDPDSIRDAQRRSTWLEWKKAIDSEYESLIKNNTWTLCSLPAGRTPISCKWVFKLKYKSTGEIDKYKARLVARGFTQRKGFDYNETYSPTAKLTTFRVLLAVAVHFNYHVHQMDVKCAFLNGELNEEIYMNQPEGFHNGTSKVCKLNRSLYGLKQASRMWNERFHRFMEKIKFKRCQSDHCLYIRASTDVTCYVLLYVDDLIIMCRDINTIQTIKRLLSSEFEMTDIGVANTFLGIHVERNENIGTIKMGQTEYFRRMLRKFNMVDCKPMATPIENGLDLEKGKINQNCDAPYRELIGCLTYATLTTRPDLCASTNFFSRFQSCFDHEHFRHAKRILRYINGTMALKLIYKKNVNAAPLVGYADADWAGDKNDRKSTSGYVFKVFGNTVSWCSRKQPTVSLSSTEAEYIALAGGICEATWLQSLLTEMGIDCGGATVIYEDNQSCIKVAEEPKEHKRMKHIDVKYNFIRDSISCGKIKLKYIPTGDQIADIMTKGLNRAGFEKHRANLDLI